MESFSSKEIATLWQRVTVRYSTPTSNLHTYMCTYAREHTYFHSSMHTQDVPFKGNTPKFSNQAPSPSSLLSHEYSSVGLSVKEVRTLVIQPPLTEPPGNRIFNTLREVFQFKLCHRRTSCILSLCFVIKHKSASSGPRP